MLLLMTQVDDVSGEVIGNFFKLAEARGARNVQIVPSITKKNRPGYIIYVDAPASAEAELAELFGAELGTWGYRVIGAEHKHFDIERLTVTVKVTVDGAQSSHPLRAKRISQSGSFARLKAEYEDLAAICAAIRDLGHTVPLFVLKASVEHELRVTKNPAEIQIDF